MDTALHQQLQALRPALLRFALLQLRDSAQAEDAVQEALLAVLEHPERFAGQSSLRTYVTGILKFKLIDCLRANRREVKPDYKEDDEDQALLEQLFDQQGHVRENASHWGEPEAAYAQKDFFRVLESCLEKLPAKNARVFMMREWLELESEEICKELQITPANLWVLLHRARLRLRECLDLHWFGQAQGKT
ncbi:sigma-70 family RNA polymerase sigma factor [Massilia sp. W12]|uniref:sigma-70 family RNA polymerase sigma factor n=1 Tax=Massilia sp. W12 TaxID=3126507 RepID=UPI0030CA813B